MDRAESESKRKFCEIHDPTTYQMIAAAPMTHVPKAGVPYSGWTSLNLSGNAPETAIESDPRLPRPNAAMPWQDGSTSTTTTDPTPPARTSPPSPV